MPIDPNIALSVRPVQTPNMLGQYAQAQEMNVNALKMQEAQQAIEDRNALRGLDFKSPDYISQVGKVNPKLALELQKGRTEARTAELDQRAKIGSLLKTSAASVLANPTIESAVMALQSFSKATGDDVTAEFNALQKIGNNPEAIKKWAMGHALTGDQILAQTDLSANQKAQLGATKRGQDLTYAAATQPVFNEAVGGFVTRPTAANPSSTVIPLANPEATTKGQVVVKGKNLVADVATDMAAAYGTLKDLGGIKSKENSPQKNISAALQSSTAGQIGGAMLGTPEQDARDLIMSQRPILVQAIVKATGMSATQINSNVELKNLLDAATDPRKGYETNISTLNKINKRFGLGGDIVELPTTPAKEKVNVGAPQKTNPNIDALLKKYE